MCRRSAASSELGRGRLRRHQRLAQPGQVEIGHAQIQHQRVEPGLADRRRRGGRVRRRHRVVAHRAQHPQQRLAALGIALEHQQVHRGHGCKLQPISGSQDSRETPIVRRQLRLTRVRHAERTRPEAAPVGARVDDPLLVLDIEQRESRRGGFTTLTLGNRHGRLATAPFWAEDRSRLAGIERGAIVARSWGRSGSTTAGASSRCSAHRLLPRGTVDWRRPPAHRRAGRALLGRLDRWRGRDPAVPGFARTLDLFYADDAVSRAATRRAPPAPPATTPSSVACSSIPAKSRPSGAPSRRVCGADAELVLAGRAAARHRQAGCLPLGRRLRDDRGRRAARPRDARAC